MAAPLRLLEATVPDDKIERVRELVADIPLVQVWNEASGPVRILLAAEQVEKLSDALVHSLGSEEGFRLVVLPVEASVPPLERPEEDNAPQQGEGESDQKDPQRISREELYEDLAQSSHLTLVQTVMVALSTVVAAIGLTRGDTAIVIGAMVIAPLLGPNVALALACTLGDPVLAKRSLKTLGFGVGLAAVLSVLLGTMLGADPASPELASRTSADLSDVILALAAGAAGSLAFTSGVSTVVVGVMVAVALLPPLVVAGLLAGAGHPKPALGALMLLATNVTCVNLAAVATFLIQRIHPRNWWEKERAKKATRLAVGIWIVLLLVLMVLMLFGDIGTRVTIGDSL